jgi:hypothetical protein
LEENFLFYVDFHFVNGNNEPFYELGSFLARSLSSLRSRGFEFYCNIPGKNSFVPFRDKISLVDKNILSNDALFFCEIIDNVNVIFMNKDNLPSEEYGKEMSKLDVLFEELGQHKQMYSLAEILLIISEDSKKFWREYKLEFLYE